MNKTNDVLSPSTTFFAPWPFFAEDEREAVNAVLSSGKVNYWTGEETRLFEKEFAEFVGVKHAVALMNGTVALEAALMALGVGAGDEVIVTSRTFIASASAIVLRGARPVMADVHPDSQNITADTIRAVLSPRTRAIIAVHLAGWPCDMDPIMELAREHGIAVVEDCAQAIGATYHGQPIGSLGDLAAFSFCQDKIVTTGGEGGMLVTNRTDLWEKAWSYKDHGKSYDAVYHRTHPSGFRWLHESFGTNWRLTEMQAAIGRIQLRKLPGWLSVRRNHAVMLRRRLASLPALRVPAPEAHVEHACYKFYAFIRPEKLKDGWTRDRVMDVINAEGVPCFSGSCSEIYLEKAFDADGLRPGSRLPVAQQLGETSLMFLVHPTLSEAAIAHTGEVVARVVSQATQTQ